MTEGAGPRRGRLLLLVVGLVAAVGVATVVVDVLRPDPPVYEVDEGPDVPLSTCSAFASPDGSDRWPGTEEEPFQTVSRLLATLPAGDTGCLMTGEYVEDELEVLRAGTTLRSAPQERATLYVDSLIIPSYASDVTISDLSIVGGDDSLTVVAIGDAFTLERNDISNDDDGMSCVLVGAQDHRTKAGVIRDNVIHSCGQDGNHLHHGIYAQNVGPDDDGTGLLIEGNVIYDVAAYAVQLYPQSIGAVVRRNVIDGGGRSIRGGIVLDGEVSRDHLIEENVIARARTGAIVQRTGTGHESRGNCFWDNARNVVGDDIDSEGDREDERCWETAEHWTETGSAALAGDCDDVEEGVLCRLLHEDEATEVPT